MTRVDPSSMAAAAVAAHARLGDFVRETPLEHSPRFSAATGADVWFKRENLQLTGSFKIRGATNRLLELSPQERAAGCVVASSGNHGAAAALAMRRLDIPGIVFVPEQTSPAKIDAIRGYGGDVRYFGSDGLDTETHAREYARRHGMFYLSPYNDAGVIAGQGSCGVEIVKQLPDVDTLYIAVGGGGLVGGVGSVLKSHDARVEIVGCQPGASAVMAQSIAAGRIVDVASEPTLSDGTAGGIEAGAVTFELCRRVVDRFQLVDESRIADAMRRFIDLEQQLIEGAAGVALAAMLADAGRSAGRRVVVLICGGNIARETLKRVL